MPDQPNPDDEIPPYLRDGTTGQPVPQRNLNTKQSPVNGVQPAANVTQLPGTKAKRKRNRLDVERIEVDYRAGVLTFREIGQRHGCAASRVAQLAKEHGWTRDIREQARHRANALVNGIVPPLPAHANTQVSLEIDQTAAAMAFVRSEHRGILKRGRTILARLLQEVEEASHGRLFLELFEEAQNESDPEKRLDYLKRGAEKLLTLPSRIYGINKLSVAAKNLMALERQAFDLDAPDDGAPPPPRSNATAAETYAWLAAQKPALPKV